MEIIIDTLKIYERLKAADLNEKAAKEIAEVIREVSLESQKGLTTKGDLAILEGRLNKRTTDSSYFIKSISHKPIVDISHFSLDT